MGLDKTSWRQLIVAEMRLRDETWREVKSCTLTEEELDEKFDAGFGLPEGKPFTLWTENRVYFPVEYDGAERAASVARNPDGKATEHVG